MIRDAPGEVCERSPWTRSWRHLTWVGSRSPKLILKEAKVRCFVRQIHGSVS